MTDQTNSEAEHTQDERAPKKGAAKQTKVKASGKQKLTEKELKAMGLDPACYGYVK